jgi:glycosyltransferase involved in cell wall biosynthesis
MPRNKKKILVFIDWYLPGFKAGGPIKSCSGMVQRLSSYFDFNIVTGNTDLNETVPYENIKSDDWNTISGGTRVYYCSSYSKNRKTITSLIHSENPDVIYLNSMFSPWFTLIPLLSVRKADKKIRVVVAPRGMLSPGALALKPLKKKIFLAASKALGLFKNVTFHASTEIEVAEIKKAFGSKANVHHAINLPPLTELKRTSRIKKENHMKMAYVGRVSEVKNLLQCLQVLQKFKVENAKIEFDIYGPGDEPAYLESCKQVAGQLPENVKVTFKGPIENKEIDGILSACHFFFLLTMNENFGHAIVEAFTSGCPVIISNRTPWKNLSSVKAGWDLPLEDEEAILKALERACNMSQAEYDEWSEAAYVYADNIHNNKETLNNNIRLFDTGYAG